MLGATGLEKAGARTRFEARRPGAAGSSGTSAHQKTSCRVRHCARNRPAASAYVLHEPPGGGELSASTRGEPSIFKSSTSALPLLQQRLDPSPPSCSTLSTPRSALMARAEAYGQYASAPVASA
jgi:hypothetical protein